MTVGNTIGMVGRMTAKVTLSFSDQTIADARLLAQRAGVSLSAWIDQAARERARREVFTAHAEALKRSRYEMEAAALADEWEIEMVDAALFATRDRSSGPDGRGRIGGAVAAGRAAAVDGRAGRPPGKAAGVDGWAPGTGGRAMEANGRAAGADGQAVGADGRAAGVDGQESPGAA